MTTLEIMVTLAIAGTFASMAVMNMDVVKQRQSERTALRQVSVMASEARNFARTSQYPVRLSVAQLNAAGQLDPAGKFFTLRWEQLPCDSADRWGNSCPAQACSAVACGTGSCKCMDQGETVKIPSALDVTPLNGLCFLGRGGAASYSSSGAATCQANGKPTVLNLRIKRRDNGKLDSVLYVDNLTGKPQLYDCTTVPLDPKCQ